LASGSSTTPTSKNSSPVPHTINVRRVGRREGGRTRPGASARDADVRDFAQRDASG
jgi:hypothetical protein